MSTTQLRNIGPKSAAWLRQVGLRTEEDLRAAGPVEAFMRIKRAGFRPSLNLLYALEGALLGCHWQDVPDARRQQMVAEVEVAAAAPVTTTRHDEEGGAAPAFDFFDSPGRDSD